MSEWKNSSLEALVFDHELNKVFFVGLLPLELNGGGIKDLVLQEQLPGGLVIPVLWDGVLGLVEVLDNLLDGLVLLDEFHGLLGAHSLDCVAVIAPKKDT